MFFSDNDIFRSRANQFRRSAVMVAILTVGLIASTSAMGQSLQQQFQFTIDVDAGAVDREDNPADAAINLTAFLAGISGTLDVASLQVAEVDDLGSLINDSVLFQFDQAPDFDATTNAAGNLVFIMDGMTAAGSTRHYLLAFDLVGVCPDCPAPPVVPFPVSVDSLTYENQDTYQVVTPRATYMYHKQGGGLASLIDQDTQDWVSFHDVPGSMSAGEYRGIPNMVFTSGDPSSSFFHPGFTNGTSQLVSSGPLKVSVRTQAGPPSDLWEVLWEFYPDFARMTVLSAGTADADPYWFLYEGTIGGGMDAGDVVVRSDGTSTSAFDYASEWEDTLAPPKWVYFRDTTAPRALFFSDYQGTGGTESYRPMGQSPASTPEMTVFGFGRTLSSLTGQLSGVNRSFTLGFVEDHTVADADIARASEPLNVLVDPQAQNMIVAQSDDFSTLDLNDTLWSFTDPLGDSSVFQENGTVTLSVPGNTPHDAWIGGNQAPRITQPVTDGDISLEAKFESLPSSRYQIQGLLFEEGPGDFIRVDVFHDGSALHLFGASFVSGSPTQHGNIIIPGGNPIWLRVDRTGNTFTVEWSDDGSVWQTGFGFDHSFVLNKVGLFAGNSGSPAPAFDAVIDYFFNTDSPIIPEDDGLVDIWPPRVTDIMVIPDISTNSALVTCITSEPATTLLSFGLDTGYGTDVVGTSGDGLSHQFTMTGLTPDANYHFSILATDALTNSGPTPDQQFLFEAIDPPVISVWGGMDQRVGHLGVGQADFNLMGNVDLWENLSTLGYSLNGGPETPLNWGDRDDGFGDGRRLASNGDFNVDLPLDQLVPGVNTLAVRAVDIYSAEDLVTVTVTKESGSSTLPYNINWGSVVTPQDVGQSVDGNWAHDPQGLRTISTGYDRLFLIGEETWQDYEIVCPITIHEVQKPTGPVSGAPGIGFMMRFTGHVVGGHRNWPDAQPKWGYQPFGGLGWLRYYNQDEPTIQFYHGDSDLADNFGLTLANAPPLALDIPPEAIPFGDESMVTNFGSASQIKVGETFFMKMRSETMPDAPNGDGVTRYSYKVWLSTESEPTEWDFQVDQQSEFALTQGSAALLAHHIDVTFGDVTIVDLSIPTPPTALDDFMALVTGSSNDIDILANDSDVDGTIDPATVSVISAPFNGTITNIDPATGIVTYLHDGGVAVADSFTYTVDDDAGMTSNIATVRLDIGAPLPPNAVDDVAYSVFGSEIIIPVLYNDIPGNGAIDPATVTIVDSPLNGSITNLNPISGTVTYLHGGGVAPADSFTYTVGDINGSTSNTALVRISIGQIPEGDFISDDFNACVLDPVWTFVDPQGDASPPTIQGAFSGDSKVQISVPGGSSHELFDGVIGAPHILQSTSDDDFTLEVKFDTSLPTVDFAEQGILVKQDETNWLRLEFYSRGSDQVYILAGLPNNMGFPTNEALPGVTAGATPLYMRVQRSGDTWTQSYSTDGSAWTAMTSFDHPLNVSGVGLYAGNAGDDPGHSILVDYFSNSLAPIASPDDQGLNSLTVNVSGNGTVTPDPDQATYSCGDPVQLTANPQAGWAFDSWSGDLTGNTNPMTVPMNAAMSVTANFIVSSPEPPVANDDLDSVVVGNSVMTDVLANDTDPNNDIDPATVAILSIPFNGTITDIDPGTGAVTYLHGGGVAVADSFTYTVEDETGLLSNVAMVRIDIDDPIAPTAVDDAGIVLFNSSAAFDVMINDTPGNGAIDPATLAIVDAPFNGLITNVNPATGVVTYAHDGGVAVVDSFTYTIDDINGATSNVAMVRVSIGQIPPGDFISDDFNACELDPVWTFVDPQGDTTAPVIQGAFSGDAQVAITVPGGTAHQLYNGTIGAPYIIQDTSDSDFTTVVKFDSVLPATDFAMQGIIVRQDDSEWLRLEFYSLDSDGISVIAVDPSNDIKYNVTIPGLAASTSPLYMRVQRAGNTWTQSYSTDGTAWTAMASFDYTLAVTGVGVYAGNAGTNPGHTVLVDYFSNSLAPIVEPDDQGQNTLTLNVAGDGTVTPDPDLPTYSCGDPVQLTAAPTSGWAFDSWSGDLTGSVNPATVTMNKALNITATFIPTGPPVAPVAVDDLAFVVVADTVEVDVLANDTDANGDIDPATVAIGSSPLNGSIINIDPATGAVSYLHDGGVAVADSFTYTVEDATGLLSNVATVRIDIGPPTPPVAEDDSLNVLAGAEGEVDVLANDSDSDGILMPGTVAVVNSPLNGSVTGIDPATGAITYLHDGGVALADSFTYTVEDNHGAVSNAATVRVFIEPLVPPTATDDVMVVLFNSSADSDVLLNDVPGNGAIDPMTLTIVDSPFNGFITNVNPTTGLVTYAHDGGVAVADSFTYTVDDINGATSNVAMVRVTIGQIPPGDFISDDFNACELDPVWTFVDPLGDATAPVIQGAFSGDAKVAITVPSGSTHQIYDGVIEAPYIMQSTSDSDFTAEVKFDSVFPASSYAMQGILVRQDDSEWLRLEFYSLSSDIIKVIAVDPSNDIKYNETIPGLVAGSSPLYMRVQRSGNTWTQSYSTDGAVWTAMASFDYTLGVTGIGVFAGNAGSDPGHTVLVDYFSNSLAPIVEPDDQGQNTLTVNSVGNGTITTDPDQPTYNCGDSVQLTANPGAGWMFDSWSGDLSGSTNPATVTMNKAMNITANFISSTGSVVAASTSGLPAISTTNPCAQGVPVLISRGDSVNMRGYTVTVALANLDLCGGIGSIIEGDYLSSIGTTDFQVTDNLDGSFDIVADIVGEPCGATAQSDTLFFLDVTNTIPDGTGTITVTALELRDCSSAPLASSPGTPADIAIDTTAPAGVTNLASGKALSGNPAGNVIGLDLSWTASTDPDAVSVLVYRKGFGSYPEYDDGGGTAVTLPVDPIAEGWELATTVPVGTDSANDLTGARDFWYYCAQAVDAAGNPSTAVMTGGLTNYLLGDASDGGAPILDGDNRVSTQDLTLLGSVYGTVDGDPLYLNTLDIGPTGDMSTDGLPTTDNKIEFEDLILLGINYGMDASNKDENLIFSNVPAPSASNTLALHQPNLPGVGETFQVELVMSGDGKIQGMTIPLDWNNNVVKPVAVQGGPLLIAQGGNSLVLSAEPGVIDVCLAGVRNVGISGVGTVATVTFEVQTAGLPQIQLTNVDARGPDNGEVPITTTATSGVDDGGNLPSVSALHPNYPNPFNPMTTIAFDLARAGRVRISIYSIDGRRVKTLVDESFAAGRHSAVWDGRDQAGRNSASGTYLYTMEGPDIKLTRRMLLIK